MAWGNVTSWTTSPTLTTNTFTVAISGSSYSTSEGSGSSFLTHKTSSKALNVNNMEGIELRKMIKSKKVNASQCV